MDRAVGTSCARVDDVRKIAVLRCNAIGDFVFTLPALDALRAAYPHAEIVLLGKDWHAEFLCGRPGPIDRVVVVPYSKGVHEPPAGAREEAAARSAFFARMRNERFDLALQLHGGGRYSNPFVLKLGARLTAGFKTPDAPALDRWVRYLYFQREILRYLEAVALVGTTATTLEPRLTVTDADLALSRDALAACAAPRVLLNPGAGDPRRRWPPEKFAAVGDALAGLGARVIVNGVGHEWPLAQAVRQAMQHEAEMLQGNLSLAAFIGVLRRCRLVVSNDSGPLHLAMAVGTPTVGIYWCGNHINAGAMSCNLHYAKLCWRLACPVCGRDTVTDGCAHDASFVADLPASEVIDAARELFERVSGVADRRHPRRFWQ